MIIIRRIFAVLIDLVLYSLFFMLLYPLINGSFGAHDIGTGLKIQTYLFFSFLIFYIGIEVIFLTTPGKWLLNLKIINNYTYKITRTDLLIRNILKYISILTIFGIPICLILYLISKKAWYDTALDLDVRYVKPKHDFLADSFINIFKIKK